MIKSFSNVFGIWLILNFIQMESFCVYFILFTIIVSWFIHINAHSCSSFNFTACRIYCLTIPHPFMLCFPVDGHLYGFQSFVLLNSTVNITTYVYCYPYMRFSRALAISHIIGHIKFLLFMTSGLAEDNSLCFSLPVIGIFLLSQRQYLITEFLPLSYVSFCKWFSFGGGLHWTMLVSYSWLYS